MIFEQENLQLQLLDVLYFNESSVAMRTRPRPFCAISLRLEGETEIELPHGKIRLVSHDLAFFPANLGYMRRTRNERKIAIHFNILNCVPYNIEVVHDYRYDILFPMFEEAIRLWEERRAGFRYRTCALLYNIFAEVRARENLPVNTYSSSVTTALSLIAEKYADPAFTVTALAEAVHMSETTFREKFRTEVGRNPKQYLTDFRLEHAQTLLNAGYDTVSAVAEKVGFRDPKNFATAFRHAYGYPPSAQHYDDAQSKKISDIYPK